MADHDHVAELPDPFPGKHVCIQARAISDLVRRFDSLEDQFPKIAALMREFGSLHLEIKRSAETARAAAEMAAETARAAADLLAKNFELLRNESRRVADRVGVLSAEMDEVMRHTSRDPKPISNPSDPPPAWEDDETTGRWELRKGGRGARLQAEVTKLATEATVKEMVLQSAESDKRTAARLTRIYQIIAILGVLASIALALFGRHF